MTIEEHYNAIAPRLTNWLTASGSQYQEACDIVQDVFLKLWKMRDDLQDSASAVSGLAFTIARNLRKNMIRDNKRIVLESQLARDDDDNAPETSLQDRAALENHAAPEQGTMPSDNDYLRRRLKEAFAKLPPILSEAYTLFQIGELSIREIAAQTGVSENLVKVRIHRAKCKLQEILSDLRVTF